VDEPVSAEKAADFRWNAFSYSDNMVLDDYEMMKSEVGEFAEAGGDCVVELTNVGLSPQPALLQRLSSDSGLKIVAGAGFYVHRRIRSGSAKHRSRRSLTKSSDRSPKGLMDRASGRA
jgi:predicted metal-dependent phosphotriesterase family hydrolase